VKLAARVHFMVRNADDNAGAIGPIRFEKDTIWSW
jgi:hypothetical protein